jgi:hypothetical protein
MSGISNPNFEDPRITEQNSITRRMGAAASGLLNTVTQKISDTSKSSGNVNFSGGGGNFQNSGNDYQFRSNRNHNFAPPNNQLPNSKNTWGPSGNGNVNFQQPQQHQQEFVNPNPIVPEIPKTAGMGRAGAATSDGTYERGLIESLCEPGGMKAVPQEDKLVSFLQTAPTLSAELVGNALLDCMNSDAWQSRVKALIVLCRLMNTSSCEEHAVWWADNGEKVSITK